MSEAALAISKKYRDLAGAIWDAALAANAAGSLTSFAVRRVQVEVYQPLLAHALDIAVQDSLDHHRDMDQFAREVSTATDKLSQGVRDVNHIGDIVGFGLALVPAVALVVAFVAAPTQATAAVAVAAIATAAGKLPVPSE